MPGRDPAQHPTRQKPDKRHLADSWHGVHHVRMTARRFPRYAVVLALLVALIPATASAHVKWFTQFSFADRPNTLTEVLSPLLFGLAGLSMLVIALLVPLDAWLQRTGIFRRLEDWLDGMRQNSTTVMRVGMGATLLLSWQADSILAPDLKIATFGPLGPILGWAQFVLALMLMLQITTPLAGVGIALLYALGVIQFGPFYMLDYAHVAGIAFFLILSNTGNPRVEGLRLPVLYAAVGFSLVWLGLEKIVYPDWGLYVLQQNPQLSMGLPVDFFLTSAAFVEISLGWLLIICLFERPLALVITLVFFSTTLVFGKVEVIGHTSVHAALIVFLLNGPGDVYRAPITFHNRKRLRAAFGAINFALVAGVLLVAYTAGAWNLYQRSIASIPTVERPLLTKLAARQEGQLIRIESSANDGVLHAFVDDQYAGVVRDGRFDLRTLAPGEHRVVFALGDPEVRVFAHNGELMMVRVIVKV
jgi:uncharacterized membrane protein YphA (DoxX/SURF4 family)